MKDEYDFLGAIRGKYSIPYNKGTNMALINDFGDSKITVKKTDLLDALRANSKKHALDYKEAYAGYAVEFVKDAEKLLAQAKTGDYSKTTINHAPPADHSQDYNRVIRMMEMCTADEIIVTESQFSQYVLDEWNWMNAFNATKLRYSNNGR